MMKKIQIAPIVKSIDSLIDAIDILIMKADEDLEEELNEEGYVETKRAVEIVNELEEELTGAFNDDCDDLLEKLQDAVDLDDFIEKTWPKISSATDLRDAIYSIFQPLFLEMLEKSVTGFLAGDDPDLLEDGMEILSKPAKDFVENWSDELAGLMNLSTKERIEGILLGGQKDHLSVMQVAQKISESSIRNPGYKARRAALTEVLRAESYGQLEAMKQNPAIAEKEWMHTGMHKNKPRPNHQAISGQRKKVDEPFDLTGADGSSYKPMCPRDTVLPAGETINCHCLMKSIRDPNWKKLSVEERRALREQYMEAAAAEDEDEHIDWPEKGQKITSEQYKEAMAYAKEKGVRLSGFKEFDGDIQTIKDLADDVSALCDEFPILVEGRRPVTIMLDSTLASVDFASTRDHIIHINANAFRDTSRLSAEYDKLVGRKWFVQGTDYRSIIRHEVGHVYANKAGITGDDAKEAVRQLIAAETISETMIEVETRLSGYAASRISGSEIVSESFSGAFASGEQHEFSLQILGALGIIQQRG